MKSTTNSQVVEVHNNPSIDLINLNIEQIRLAEFDELLNDHSIVWTPYNKDLLRTLIDSSNISNLMLQNYNSDIIGSLFFMSIGG